MEKKEDMDVESKVQEMLYMYDVYEKKANQLVLLREKIEKKINEYDIVIKSIEGLKEDHDEYILPISSRVYVKVGSVNKKNLFVNIGSNIVVEMSHDKAIKYFEKLKEKASAELTRLDDMIEDVVGQMEKIRQQLESSGVI